VSARNERQHVLRVLLDDRELRTQAEVRAALADAGHAAHPATIGRDLEELGARRVRTQDGRLAYRIGEAPLVPAAPPDLLDEALRRYVLRVDASGNLLVLRTPPACASPVASALDTSGGPSILGTLAGDDTVIAVIATGFDPLEVADSLRARSAAASFATAASDPRSQPPRAPHDRSSS
jgi:transcriptional regulator of arginine metabolism